jgi:hypothetical protein
MIRVLARLALVLGMVAVVTACGKKGSPLAPLVRIPSPIQTVRAERLGNEVYLTLTVPATNIDRSVPVDIARIDVYAYTGRTAPPTGRFTEAGTLVASIPITMPLPVGATAPPPSTTSAAVAPLPAGVATAPAAAPGAMVTVVDTLTSDELVPGKVLAPLPVGGRPRTPPVTTTPVAAVAANAPLRRYYVAIPFSRREVPGPQPAPSSLPLFEAPPPPADFRVVVGPNGAAMSWQPGGGLIGFLLSNVLPDERPPDEDVFAVPRPAVPGAEAAVARPSGPLKYNLYRLTPPVSTPPVAAPPAATPAPAGPPAPAAPVRPLPLNPMPLTMPAFTDTVAFGVEHCYVARAIRGDGAAAIEGEPSEPFCFTPADRFPPAPPAGLVAVAAEGSVSLIWEPASEPDLAGYVVLRGTAGDATLQPLTPMPVAEARFADSTAVAGTRYVYAVVSVDTAMNVSAESNRVEETAR